MPQHVHGTAAPRTAVFRVVEITKAETLEPGTYAIQRGDEWLRITLRQAITVLELAVIVERVSSIQILRVA